MAWELIRQGGAGNAEGVEKGKAWDLTRKRLKETYLPGMQAKLRKHFGQRSSSHPMRAGVLAKHLLGQWGYAWALREKRSCRTDKQPSTVALDVSAKE